MSRGVLTFTSERVARSFARGFVGRRVEVVEVGGELGKRWAVVSPATAKKYRAAREASARKARKKGGAR